MSFGARLPAKLPEQHGDRARLLGPLGKRLGSEGVRLQACQEPAVELVGTVWLQQGVQGQRLDVTEVALDRRGVLDRARVGAVGIVTAGPSVSLPLFPSQGWHGWAGAKPR